MRVFHTHSPCLEQGGGYRSLAQDIWPQTLPGPYSPGCCAADSDYNASANDPQHISTHRYANTTIVSSAIDSNPPNSLNRQEIRFLYDVAHHHLCATVSRYERLNLSRRKGNAIRQSLLSGKLIEPVTLATRSGQVVLYQLTDAGRTVCQAHQIDPGPVSRESLEHRWWIRKTRDHFERKGYEVTLEHPIKGNGAIDLLAVRPGERVAVEVETGKSDIKQNLLHMMISDNYSYRSTTIRITGSV